MASVEKQASIDALTGEQLRLIQHAACGFVSACVQNQTFSIESALGELARQPIAGIYVTLKRGETLRGCCGMQGSSVPLARALADAATRTAKHDPRMAPIAPVELPHLTLTISILGPPRPIEASGEDRVDMIEIGRHGLRIRRGKNVGLLLPVVATERSWNARQFLDAVCNKAGLPPGSWLSDDSEVELFDGVSFGAPMQVLNASRDVSIYTADQLQKLRDWVTYNVSALETGATPFYYATDVSDTSVNGIALRVTHLPRGTNSSWLQLNIREGLPLQSTLFQMTQTAASALRGMGPSNEWSIDVAVLSTVIHHGTDTEHDLESVDGKTRSLILMDGSRWSMCFDQSLNNEMLLQRALQSQPFRTGSTMVYSAVCETTSPSLVVSWGPRGENTISTRPPAVAGKFYPSADTDRESLVDQLLSDLPQTERQSVSAAMVPHAGLQYSGRIAADVWRRIQLPKNVLIIGPKHTRDGVDWAVAPHDVWSLSETARMNGNVELAKQLAVSIDGMELDAAAHRGEHGTEVHLPLLYRLAPGTQVTAIAMAEAPIESLRVAANQLADCLAALDDPPLLVISSDMNHFADEEENRRRDRIALELLSKNDPAALLKTCAEQNISMCGRVPAALVLMTLHHLGKTVQYRETGYDTSGTITGDRSRVVGYAGVLL
ncbi:MAG: AmmeMemoRadiSam system protein B [Planctomycetota bacterium]